MRITATHSELSTRLGLVGRALSTRSASVQILSGVLLVAESSEQPAELAATDMEISLRVPLAVTVESPGRCVLPGKLITEVVRRLPSGQPISLAQESDDGRIQLGAGSSSAKLDTFAADDFPRLPEIDHERLFALDRAAFLATIRRVARASSRDESRPVLTGVQVELTRDRVTMAATDSYRMAVRSAPLSAGPPEDVTAIIPARALEELTRLADAVEGDDLVMGIEQNQVIFGLGGVWLTARRIEGQFPNWRQLKPDGFEHEVLLPRGELLDVLGRVGVLAQRNAPLRLRFEPGELVVSARTQDVGEARDALPCDFRGEPLDIGYNAAFLRDGVDSVEEDDVRLKLISPLRPSILTGSDPDFWYLVMPIRISQ